MNTTITRILPDWHQDCGLIFTKHPDPARWARFEKDEELLTLNKYIETGSAKWTSTLRPMDRAGGDRKWLLTVNVRWIIPQDAMLFTLATGTSGK